MVAIATEQRRYEPTQHDFAIASVIAVMRRDPTRALTLQQQAEIAGFSPFHFARLFREVIGIPPGEFLTALRFERSKELLLTTDASVTDICYEIGYESLGTFSSRFRQLVGVSPQQFRRFPQILTPDLFAEREEIPRILGPTGSVMGRISMTEPGPKMSVYIGVFSAAIARGFPTAGKFIPVHGDYCIDDIPPGGYTLLAAAIPVDAGPMAHLTPGASLRVGVGGSKIVITQRGETVFCDVVLRKLSPCDPPILISLPALLLPAEEMRRREEALGIDLRVG
jgi:AraC-like DNA-binding protein